MTFLERVCLAFNQTSLRYALVGGHAVALHGAPRGTIDIDYVINWELSSLKLAEKVLQDLGLESRLPVSAEDIFNFRDEYINNRNLIAWSFYNPRDLSEQVDIIINYNLKGQKTEQIALNQANVSILNKKALIDMKKASGRPQDIEDIKALEQLL